MKKSTPVSDNLTEYFSNPCPVLSDNNSQFILDEINKGYDWVVEYGMGASTLYFLNAAQKHKGTMISIENNYDWFEICVEQIKNKTPFREASSFSQLWSLKDINAFVKGKPCNDVPENLLRFPLWQEHFSTGPFFRFSPKSKSRLSGKLGPLWPVLKPLFMIGAKINYMITPHSRPRDAQWHGTNGTLELILRNAGPSVKDQYGEAPNMMNYIDAGLKDIRSALEEGKVVSALFMIDGGPRHKIVEEILKLEDLYKNFKPCIALCDAHRAFYRPTLQKRPAGKFLSGSNRTLKGGPVETGIEGSAALFWAGGDKAAGELSQQEVWFYKA